MKMAGENSPDSSNPSHPGHEGDYGNEGPNLPGHGDTGRRRVLRAPLLRGEGKYGGARSLGGQLRHSPLWRRLRNNRVSDGFI